MTSTSFSGRLRCRSFHVTRSWEFNASSSSSLEDDSHDKRGERLDLSVTVWMIIICRLDGVDHSEQHDDRCEGVTGEFDAGRENGRGCCGDADDKY